MECIHVYCPSGPGIGIVLARRVDSLGLIWSRVREVELRLVDR